MQCNNEKSQKRAIKNPNSLSLGYTHTQSFKSTEETAPTRLMSLSVVYIKCFTYTREIIVLSKYFYKLIEISQLKVITC